MKTKKTMSNINKIADKIAKDLTSMYVIQFSLAMYTVGDCNTPYRKAVVDLTKMLGGDKYRGLAQSYILNNVMPEVSAEKGEFFFNFIKTKAEIEYNQR